MDWGEDRTSFEAKCLAPTVKPWSKPGLLVFGTLYFNKPHFKFHTQIDLALNVDTLPYLCKLCSLYAF
jgi:hypothetical protein